MGLLNVTTGGADGPVLGGGWGGFGDIGTVNGVVGLGLGDGGVVRTGLGSGL